VAVGGAACLLRRQVQLRPTICPTALLPRCLYSMGVSIAQFDARSSHFPKQVLLPALYASGRRSHVAIRVV